MTIIAKTSTIAWRY